MALDEEEVSPAPLLVLTGFLGAGKTTALNRVLAGNPRGRLGVIVNELGRIDVDARLLRARSDDVVELAGGCVCHEVRTQEELWEGLRELHARARPDWVVLETTGIAEPAPILAGLRALPPEARVVYPAGVVTVVDAEAGVAQLERFAEARRQVEEARALLVTKLDRAGASAVAALHAALDTLNPRAERASFPAGAEGDVELGAWLRELAATGDAEARAGVSGYAHACHGETHHDEARHGDAHHGHAHAGPGQLVATAFVDDAPLSEPALRAALDAWGDRLVRVKGFVRLAGWASPAFVERAGSATTLRPADATGARPPARTELVLIGVDLEPAVVRRRLWTCRVAGGAA